MGALRRGGLTTQQHIHLLGAQPALRHSGRPVGRFLRTQQSTRQNLVRPPPPGGQAPHTAKSLSHWRQKLRSTVHWRHRLWATQEFILSGSAPYTTCTPSPKQRKLYTSEKQKAQRGRPFQSAYSGWSVPTNKCGYFEVHV